MSRIMYLVVRRALKDDGTACYNQFVNDTGSRVPVRLFADRQAAERFTAELLAGARRTMNPFHLLNQYVSEDQCKGLAALAFPVDCPDDDWYEDWRTWWDLCLDSLSDEQRAAAWAVFAAAPPYEVTEIEVREE